MAWAIKLIATVIDIRALRRWSYESMFIKDQSLAARNSAGDWRSGNSNDQHLATRKNGDPDETRNGARTLTYRRERPSDLDAWTYRHYCIHHHACFELPYCFCSFSTAVTHPEFRPSHLTAKIANQSQRSGAAADRLSHGLSGETGLGVLKPAADDLMPWLTAPGVKFSSCAASLKLPQRATVAKSRKPFSAGSFSRMSQRSERLRVYSPLFE
jgi:hypothetical protein